MSWIKRKWQGLLDRMVGEKAPPEFTARGWAIGMFYGCTIPFGFQLMLSVPTAILLRGSKVGATVGTFITNHFTIFLIYPVQFWIGNLFLGVLGVGVRPIDEIVEEFLRVGRLSILSREFWSAMGQLGPDIVYSFFIGGFALAVLFVPPTYYGVLTYVRRHRARRQAEAAGKEVSA